VVDEWSWHQAGKLLLHWLPAIAAFIAGGAWSLLLVRLTRWKVKKEWDADFLSRYKEEHRSEIQERDAHIASIEAQLKEEREARGELERRARVAVALTRKVSEALLTVDSIPMFRVGSESFRAATRRSK
jgi:hypothetical protein